MNPVAPFGSILLDRPHDRGERDDPSMFADLNLDQVFAAAAAGRDEYDLTSFFRVPLHDPPDGGIPPSGPAGPGERDGIEAGIRIIFVTHMFDLAGRYYTAHDPAALFLRAERRPDGQRTFRVPPGEPLPTSYGEDLYQQVFGPAGTEARV